MPQIDRDPCAGWRLHPRPGRHPRVSEVGESQDHGERGARVRCVLVKLIERPRWRSLARLVSINELLDGAVGSRLRCTCMAGRILFSEDGDRTTGQPTGVRRIGRAVRTSRQTQEEGSY